ncbi:unnamed protein product, partial [Rotaria sp. Silwood2]
MEKLKVLSPSFVTHSSNYVPEMTKFTNKIVRNGYAYKLNLTVYFDTLKFYEKHSYAQLEPDRMDDVKSKPDEPTCESPWGIGRPYSDIQCATITNILLGSPLDIHIGDINPKFSHHKNKSAQCKEYHANADSWVNLTYRYQTLSISSNYIGATDQILEQYSFLIKFIYYF